MDYNSILNNLKDGVNLNIKEIISFKEFLDFLEKKPEIVFRNIFQLFYDMVNYYIGKGYDEYENDPESINFRNYDCRKLFIDNTDNPFFVDRIFANRFINLISTLRVGALQNKIYIFEGPPGSGKSTFLNNILQKFEEYAKTENGSIYEIVWRIDKSLFGNYKEKNQAPIVETLLKHLKYDQTEIQVQSNKDNGINYFDISCPSHDNPVLIIPKEYRREFFDNIFKNNKFKWQLFTSKEYEWVFKEQPCTICTSIFSSLLERIKDPLKIFEMIYIKKVDFNRRLGQGISVFNPGDNNAKQDIISNKIIQNRLNNLFQDSNAVKYIYSHFANTNNGIYSLMDIKSNNILRLIELHNIVSEGVHKVSHLEERIKSLFLAVLNPEDKKQIVEKKAFSDRLNYIKIPYILDSKTEVEIYKNIYGKHIPENFLPRVLDNFARIIISTRMKKKSEVLSNWLKDFSKYKLFCDKNMLLLKMDLYSGKIPKWLTDEDRKKFTKKIRRKLILEAENEGFLGFSGRNSIKIFGSFYKRFAKEDFLINMLMVKKYFTEIKKDLMKDIPEGFIDSLIDLYDYNILQMVKECLYFYNEDEISKEIQNYLFAINYEPEIELKSKYTNENIIINYNYFKDKEEKLLGQEIELYKRKKFRMEMQKIYTSKTLTQEILIQEKKINETEQYKYLFKRYTFQLKEKALEPFSGNENFRRAIKDFGKDEYKTYSKSLRNSVEFLISNLIKNYKYTKKGAKEVCIYVIDNDLAKKYKKR